VGGSLFILPSPFPNASTLPSSNTTIKRVRPLASSVLASIAMCSGSTARNSEADGDG
jgi:hypothetical protein